MLHGPAPRLAILAAFALLLAGCAGPAPTTPGAPPLPDDDTPADGFPDQGGAPPAPPEAPRPLVVQFFLTPEGGLSLVEPPSGTFPEGTNFFDAGIQTGSTEFRPWVLDQPLPAALLVTEGQVDLWFSSEHPRAAIAPTIGFEPVTLWFGRVPAWSPTMQYSAPQTLQPGEVAHATGPMVLPRGGLVLDTGTSPALMLGFGYDQSTASPILVHAGGETASRLTLTVVPFFPPTHGSVEELRFTGEFPARHFLVPPLDPAQAESRFPLTIGAGTIQVEVELSGRSAAGHLDLDLVLEDPAGQPVWSSTNPGATEALALYRVNFAGPGEYQIVVQSFQAVQATFEVVVRVHEGLPEGGLA